MSNASNDARPAIVHALTTLQKRELALKQPFKARAYRAVIQQILQLNHPVRQWSDLATIKGIGEQIRNKIQEILETGHLHAADVAEEKYSLSLRDELQKIYGIGPSAATKLIQEHGVQSIEHLRELVAENPSLLTKNQRIGLQYYEALQQRIPRAEMEQHYRYLADILGPLDIEFDVVGSYRRGAPDSGDIDVLIKDNQTISLTQIVELLQQSEYLLEILALGTHKCMGICRLGGAEAVPRRLDLLMTPPDEYPYALLYFTGSDRFNVAMRQHALDKGYSINEHGSTPPLPPVHSERDLFHALGLAYVAPERRVDREQLRKWKPTPKSIMDPS